MKIYKYKKGQALVETALVLPVILLLLFGIIEFGRILNTYILLTNASREGARYAVVGHKEPEVKQAVKDRLPTLITLKDDDIDVDKTGENVTVTVDYALPLITPVLKNLVSPDGTFSIESSTVMRAE